MPDQGLFLMEMTATQLLFVLALLLTVTAAGFDVARYRIPNWVVISLITIFVGVCATAGLSLSAIGLHLLIAALVLAACFGMFAAGWLGAGDGKLLAVLALVIGPSGIAPLLFTTAYAGGALAILVSMLATRAVPVWLEGVGIAGGYRIGMKRVPYGVAIAAGAGAALIPMILR